MTETQKVSRREQILQALAEMLEQSPGERITTANLAKQVGVSEAALYRHFPSKAKMFEGLIGFIEDTIFSRINRISEDFKQVDQRLEHTLSLILGFAEKNPGLCRLLSGDALSGEIERLRHRIQQFFERIDAQLKQFIKEAEVMEGKLCIHPPSVEANLLLGLLEGRIRQYVRSEFKQIPTEYWPEQWELLKPALFRTIS